MVKVDAFFACALAFLDIDLLDCFASSLLSSDLPDLVLSSSPMVGNCCYRVSRVDRITPRALCCGLSHSQQIAVVGVALRLIAP